MVLPNPNCVKKRRAVYLCGIAGVFPGAARIPRVPVDPES